MAHTHSEQFASFADFYPYYLNEHQNATSRRLHFIGSLGVIGCVAMAVATGRWPWLPAAVVCGYGLHGSGTSSSRRTALPRSGIRSTA
jgi:hypothetical protein